MSIGSGRSFARAISAGSAPVWAAMLVRVSPGLVVNVEADPAAPSNTEDMADSLMSSVLDHLTLRLFSLRVSDTLARIGVPSVRNIRNVQLMPSSTHSNLKDPHWKMQWGGRLTSCFVSSSMSSTLLVKNSRRGWTYLS